MGVTLQQFEQMKRRTSGPRRSAAPLLDQAAPVNAIRHQIILGVDPSLRGTGFGVIQITRGQPAALEMGSIPCPAGWDRSRCLLKIATTLREVIQRRRPTVCAIEGLFYAQNYQTALIMGEARGAALVAAAEGGLEILEIAPRKVKQAVVGYGAAQKIAVARMVQRLLKLPEVPQADAADALAIAIAFAQEQGRFSISPSKRI